MNPPTRFSATVPSVTFSAKLISRDADLFVGCADDVDQQEEGGGMKVEGGHQRRPLVWCEDNKVSLLVSLLLFFLLVWPLVVFSS